MLPYKSIVSKQGHKRAPPDFFPRHAICCQNYITDVFTYSKKPSWTASAN